MCDIFDVAQAALDAEGSVVLAIALLDNEIADTTVEQSDSDKMLKLAARQSLSAFGSQLTIPVQ
jgi:hypothetical protein